MTDKPQSGAVASQPTGGESSSVKSRTAIDSSRLVKSLVAFRKPSARRSWYELAVTFLPFIVVVAIMMFGVTKSYYSALLLTPLSGLLLLRMFIIQHDCGHGAFMPSKRSNDWIGRSIGVLTLTPYDCWRRSHELHHAGTGNLDARGFGDVDTLTVREFQSLSPLKRFGYRLYRHPVTILGFGPAYLFLLRHRLPIGLMKAGARYWISAMATNAAAGFLLAVLSWRFGLGTTLLVFLPTLIFAATVGVWLFYIQHQFEGTHWDPRSDWSFKEAALHGSSYLDLPAPLRWFTGGIGIHHIHHLMSRIPFYRLHEALGAHPELASVNRITPRQTIRPFLLSLWDEEKRKMVRFRDV
ncbi:MAG: fatty acid desaturase [Pseudomonadota bacterium]